MLIGPKSLIFDQTF